MSGMPVLADVDKDVWARTRLQFGHAAKCREMKRAYFFLSICSEIMFIFFESEAERLRIDLGRL